MKHEGGEAMERKEYEVLGWAWAKACSHLDKGEDPRKIEASDVIAAFERDFPEVANGWRHLRTSASLTGLP